MRYLYGDSSSFPLNENFLETLEAATACAASLLTIDEIILRARHTSEQAHGEAKRELADLDRMAKNVARSLSQEKALSEANQKVVRQVATAAKAQFDRARDQVTAWRDATIHKAKLGSGAKDVMAPLHDFFTRYELPYTSWGLRWRAGSGDEAVQAQVYAIMQRGLTASLGVAIPERHLWATPPRVSTLEKKLTIQLLGKSWLGKEKMRDEHLDKLYVTRVTRTAEKHVLTLQRKHKEPSSGVRITFRDGEDQQVWVQRVDEGEQAVGDRAKIDGIDALALRKLWRKIEEGLSDLVHHRAHLLAAELYGKRITELDTPAPVAEIVILAVAPLCQDIVRHSRTPGELQLKRDLGDGRREELFIGADTIRRRYASLTPKNRELFLGFGIDAAPAAPSVARAEVLEEHPVVHAEPFFPPPPALPAESYETSHDLHHEPVFDEPIHQEATHFAPPAAASTPASAFEQAPASWDEPPAHWTAPSPPSSQGHPRSEIVARADTPVAIPPPAAPPVSHRPLPRPSAPPVRRSEPRQAAQVYQLRAPRVVNG